MGTSYTEGIEMTRSWEVLDAKGHKWGVLSGRIGQVIHFDCSGGYHLRFLGVK